MQDRRVFLRSVLGAWAAAAYPAFGAGWKSGWLEAFREAGFDPEAAGSAVFVVCGFALCT